jgi:hypothetical protein
MRKLVAVALGLAASAAVFTPRDAAACGGCFVPPEDSTAILDHRMILSISPQETTLYDQIRYQGNPSSFAWVLPISGEVEVGLSADLLFQVMGIRTQVNIQAPPLNCPPPPVCDHESFSDSARGGAQDAAAGPTAGGVEVTKQETVGPYETVQLKATDANALNQWLIDHKYNIPEDIKPLIAQYVSEHYDFLAMKLVPGKTVQAMRPVRVTSRGASPVLPLRMVAAGTGATVGITLWVVGDGRYETQNFPMFHVGADELTWDWTQGQSDFRAIRAKKTADSNGRGWELESSMSLFTSDIEFTLQRASFGPQTTGDYVPATDANGQPVGTAEDARKADLAKLFGGKTGSFRATRLRSDLSRAALAEDLVLRASTDQSLVPNVRQVTKELNQPQCPIYNGCSPVGQLPRDEAIAHANAQKSGGDTFSCQTAKSSMGPAMPLTILGLGAFFGVIVIRARRRVSP